MHPRIQERIVNVTIMRGRARHRKACGLNMKTAYTACRVTGESNTIAMSIEVSVPAKHAVMPDGSPFDWKLVDKV